MTEQIKKAVREAEEELENEQVKKIKVIVKDTLSKIKDIEDDIKELEEEKKILKLDIENLKEGRLDRIEERQSVDKKAKRISVIIVEKEVHHHHYDRWYEPFKITYIPYYPPVQPTIPSPVWYDTNKFLCSGGNTVGYATSGQSATVNACDVFTLNSSTAKNFTCGTYAVGDKTVYLQ